MYAPNEYLPDARNLKGVTALLKFPLKNVDMHLSFYIREDGYVSSCPDSATIPSVLDSIATLSSPIALIAL